MSKPLEGMIVHVVGSAPVGRAISAAFVKNGAQLTCEAAGQDPDERARGMGDIDVLIDVGGAFKAQPFTQITDDVWRDVFEENVMEGARCARQALPGMLLRNRGVLIVVVGNRAVERSWDYIHQEVASRARLATGLELARLVTNTKVAVTTVPAEMSEDKSGLASGTRSVCDGPLFSVESVIAYVIELLGL